MEEKAREESSEARQRLTVDCQSGSTARCVDFDEILPHLGEFGRYQQLLFVMMAPFGFFFAAVYFSQMFMTVTPRQHWCWIPELANYTVEERRAMAIPVDLSKEFGHSQCTMYHVDWREILSSTGNTLNYTKWPIVDCQHGWEYNRSEIPYETISTELDWVCDKNSYQTIAQAIFFCGSICGGVLIGWLADKYGRVPALVVSNMFGCIGSVLTIFSSNLWQFALYRFITGMAYDNCFIIIYIIVLEYVGASYRTWTANLSIALFFGAGCVVLPWIAYGLSDWRMFALVTGAPMGIALLAPLVVPESARWLMSCGRTNDAIKVIHRFEKVNGTKVPEKILDDLRESSKNPGNCQQKDVTLWTLLKSSLLRTMLFYIVIVYMASACAFDALVRLSDSLGLDFHLTFTLTSATEIPSVTLLTFVLDRFGRRWMSTGPMLISAMFSLLAGILPSGIPSTVCAIGGRFFINMSYNVAIQWSIELLPTSVRAAGSSAMHITGYIATLLSPFTVYLEKIVPSLSLYVIAMTTVIGALFALLLPETLGRDMPQTIQDGEQAMLERPSLCCFGRERIIQSTLEAAQEDDSDKFTNA